MPYEQALGGWVYGQGGEKSLTDKLLSRKEVIRLCALMKKDDLNRSELLEMLYMMSSAELKLANFNEYDRYLLGKYFTWIRDLVKITEFMFDYIDKLTGELQKDGTFKGGYAFKNEANKTVILDSLERTKKMMLHNVKFSVDVFLYLERSTTAISAFGFDRLSTNRQEIEYTNPYTPVENVQQQSNKPLMSLRGR